MMPIKRGRRKKVGMRKGMMKRVKKKMERKKPLTTIFLCSITGLPYCTPARNDITPTYLGAQTIKIV